MSKSSQVSQPADLPADASSQPPDGRRTRQLRQLPLSEVARSRIMKVILDGDLKPGEVFKIADLAAQFGMSRTPVREALGTLEHEGVIHTIPYRGYTVKHITVEDARDLYFVRSLIEGAAAERATTRITETELAQLANSLKVRPAEDQIYTSEYDADSLDFHEVIVGAAHSQRLSHTFKQLINDSRRLGIISALRPDPQDIFIEHQNILEALIAGNAERAKRSMERHVQARRFDVISNLLDVDRTN